MSDAKHDEIHRSSSSLIEKIQRFLSHYVLFFSYSMGTCIPQSL